MAKMCEMFRAVHDVERFTWNSKDKTLVSELSDIGFQAFERVYPDACDCGLTIVNSDKGTSAVFYLSKEDRDKEGDLRFYELLPTPESIRKYPKLQGVKVILFND